LYQVELNYDQQEHRLVADPQYFVDLMQNQVVEMVMVLEAVLDELM
jgi:hypothetical protein